MHTSPNGFFLKKKEKEKEEKKKLVKYPSILSFACADSETTLFDTVDSIPVPTLRNS